MEFFYVINHGIWGKTSKRGVRIIKWYTARSCILNLHPILILILLLILILIITIIRDGLSPLALLTLQGTTSKRAKAARSIWSCLSPSAQIDAKNCKKMPVEGLFFREHKLLKLLTLLKLLKLLYLDFSAIQKWMM